MYKYPVVRAETEICILNGDFPTKKKTDLDHHVSIYIQIVEEYSVVCTPHSSRYPLPLTAGKFYEIVNCFTSAEIFFLPVLQLFKITDLMNCSDKC